MSDYQAGIAETRGCKCSLRNRMQPCGRRDMIERACNILYAQLLRITRGGSCVLCLVEAARTAAADLLWHDCRSRILCALRRHYTSPAKSYFASSNLLGAWMGKGSRRRSPAVANTALNDPVGRDACGIVIVSSSAQSRPGYVRNWHCLNRSGEAAAERPQRHQRRASGGLVLMGDQAKSAKIQGHTFAGGKRWAAFSPLLATSRHKLWRGGFAVLRNKKGA